MRHGLSSGFHPCGASSPTIFVSLWCQLFCRRPTHLSVLALTSRTRSEFLYNSSFRLVSLPKFCSEFWCGLNIFHKVLLQNFRERRFFCVGIFHVSHTYISTGLTIRLYCKETLIALHNTLFYFFSYVFRCKHCTKISECLDVFKIGALHCGIHPNAAVILLQS